MNGLTTVLPLALIPAVANFLGGLLSEVVPSSGRLLSAALHLATGIVIAVAGLEPTPSAVSAPCRATPCAPPAAPAATQVDGD
ncbi:hypothetical protein ACLIYP_15550 [Streptomyces nanhaiensis]|uniref:hypothetical protein n=1 Tax=Streptomyces nanhaiensis TaxID=679319 RepID=UPI00399C8420